MVIQRYGDLLDDSGRIHFDAWRCVSCGEVVDSVILGNRRKRPAPFAHGNRKLKIASRR